MPREKKVCGRPCDVFSRIVGYYRNVSNWNIGKKKEFSERITFKVIAKDEQTNDSSERD